MLKFNTLADVPSEFATVLFPGRASVAHLAALPSTHGKGNALPWSDTGSKSQARVISSFCHVWGILGLARLVQRRRFSLWSH